MSILLAQADDGRGPGVGRRVREHVLAVRRRRERDAAQRPAGRVHRAARAPGGAARAARRPGPDASRGGRDAALVDAGHDVPPDREPATANSAASASAPGTRSSSRSPRRTATKPSSPILTVSTSAAIPTRTWSSVTARTSAWAPTWPASRCARCSRRCWPARPRSTYAGQPSYLRSNFQRGVKRLPVAWTA